MKNLELKSKDKNKEILDATKSIKIQRQPKKLKRILTSSRFEEKTTQVVSKFNHKRCKICNIIIKGKSYTFKIPETKCRINEDLSCNSKNVVYINECGECKEIYRGSTQPHNTRISQPLNTRTSLQKSIIKIEENRKMNVTKHLYQCSQVNSKVC